MLTERIRLINLASLAVLALSGPAVMAQGRMTQGELELWAEPEPKGEANHGYTEYRVYIHNKGKESTYRVTLKVPGETFYGGRGRGALQAITRTVSVGPGLVTVASLYQPSSPDVFGDGVAVYIDGRQVKQRLPLRPASNRSRGYVYRGGRGRVYYGIGPGSGGTQPLVLMSQRVNENFFKVTTPAGGAPPAVGPGAGGPFPPGGMGGPGGFGGRGMGMGGTSAPATRINAQFIRSDMPVSVWTSHWLGYSRYDGIVLTREDMQELQSGSNDTRAVLRALWQYAETGGVLLVLGPGSVAVPQGWTRHVVDREGLKSHQVGFGECLVASDRNSDKWGLERWGLINSAVNSTASPWSSSSQSLSDLNTTFPVVDNLGVPVIGLFILMILFAIALGPVNLVVLSKKKKRIWMLWTVPLLSGITCLAVFGFMIVAEGWQGHAVAGGITFLDEIDHRATSLGRTAFYSPLTPGAGLQFSEDTEISILGGGESEPSVCSMDWTQGQHLAHGWVQARVPAHFAVRCSETRRERLTVRREADGKLSVVNGLGANIKKLTVADEKGLLFVASGIPAGERATLERGEGSIKEKGEYKYRKNGAWRRIFKSGNEWIIGAKVPSELLGPRMYLAVLEGSPFHEQALHGARVRKSESVVVGIMAPEGK
jgi:hypothetical protein